MGLLIIYQKDIHNIMMNKTLLVLCILSALTLIRAETIPNFPTHGMQAFFFSPKALGQTRQGQKAIEMLKGKTPINDITYKLGSLIYRLTNITITMNYVNTEQEVTQPVHNPVEVRGGKVKFTYRVDYTRQGGDRFPIAGHGSGSVLSDNITFVKSFGRQKNYFRWKLLNDQDLNVQISSPLAFQSLAASDVDRRHLEAMLNNVSPGVISPDPLRKQLLTSFNSQFPQALDLSLNEPVMNQTIEYVYSSYKGETSLSLTHHQFIWQIKPDTGFSFLAWLQINNYTDSMCQSQTQQWPQDFKLYGGVQNFQHNCFYEEVVRYLGSKGELNTLLNNDFWGSQDFHFKAGELFEFVNGTAQYFDSDAPLSGKCLAEVGKAIRLWPSQDQTNPAFDLRINHNCELQGVAKSGEAMTVLKFRTGSKMTVTIVPHETQLQVKITDASLGHLQNEDLPPFVVKKQESVFYKVDKVVKQVIGMKAFGTGFPTLPRQDPGLKIVMDSAMYYDTPESTPQVLVQEQ